MVTARGLLLLLSVGLAACGGGAAGPAVQDPAPSSTFTAADPQMELSQEQRDALAEAGFHPEGLLQGQPAACRVAEYAEGDDGRLAARIAAELGPDVRRGPLIAVDAADGVVVLAATLVTADGSIDDTAAWAATDGDPSTITAANVLAADLTSFDLEPIETAGEGPASSALAGAQDCSWGAADVTHPDPPEPAPQMRPDLLTLDPATARPGELIALRFPEETTRGIAFQLDRKAGDAWQPVAWMTSDGNGDDPVTVPAFTDGYGVEDVGVGGPGPDHVRLPDDLVAGEYRICTANAGDEFCAPLTVTG